MNKFILPCLGFILIGVFGPLYGQELIDKDATKKKKSTLQQSQKNFRARGTFWTLGPEDQYLSSASVVVRNELIGNNLKLSKKLKLR